MTIKLYKPTSPSRRGASVISYREIDKVEPYGPLTVKKSRSGGRNNSGRITVRHRGGGNKRHYRIIDFKRNKIGVPGKVEYIEYDPNRTAFIARVVYCDGERRYILAPAALKRAMKLSLRRRKLMLGLVMPCLLKRFHSERQFIILK